MPVTAYCDIRFHRHIIPPLNTIVEVGARYGDESLELSNLFQAAKIYSFECNPKTVEQCRKTLANAPNVTFSSYALGSSESTLPFFRYTKDNDGASSLYKRIDADETQEYAGLVETRRLDSILGDQVIDLLCMDVQGYELEVLKGTNLSKVRYIIQEEPNPVINTNFLPPRTHSKYIDAPSSSEISSFLHSNNFRELERLQENYIEDNVLWANVDLNGL